MTMSSQTLADQYQQWRDMRNTIFFIYILFLFIYHQACCVEIILKTVESNMLDKHSVQRKSKGKTIMMIITSTSFVVRFLIINLY